MKTRFFCKCVCLAASAAVLLSSFSAASAPPDGNISGACGPEPPQAESSDFTQVQDESAKLSERDIPEAIGNREIQDSGLSARLYKQEPNLNTVLFQNRNGQKTVYMYDYPVKYIDENGNVRDKKSDLTAESESELTADYAFMSASNDIKTHFPKKIDCDTGVILKHGGICIESTPVLSKKSTDDLSRQVDTAKITHISEARKKTITIDEKNKDEITYGSVFGDNTAIKYTVSPQGYKENIVLKSGCQENQFTYKIKTGGLKLSQSDDSLSLADPVSGKVKVTVGRLLVYDSRVGCTDDYEPQESELSAMNDNYNHHYEIQTVDENNEYILTMVIDDKYLSSPDTQYPVVIDPSYNFVFDEGTSSAPLSRNIIDATITKGKPGSNYGNAKTLIIGNFNERYPKGTKYGRCRVLMSFSSVKSTLSYMDVPLSAVTSANLFLKSIHQQSDAVTVKAYKVNGSWNEDSATATKCWDLRGSNISSRVVKANAGTDKGGSTSGGNWFSWNVLPCVKDGVSGSVRSVMLCAASTTDKAKEFASCQYTEAVSSRPYVKLSYRIPVSSIKLNKTSAELYPGQTVALNASVSPYNVTNGTVTFSSSNTDVATVDRTGIVTAKTNDGSTTITAKANDGSGAYASCNVTVKYLQTFSKGECIHTIYGGIVPVALPFHYGTSARYYIIGNKLTIAELGTYSYYTNKSPAFWLDIQNPPWIVASNSDNSFQQKFILTKENNTISSSDWDNYVQLVSKPECTINYDKIYCQATFSSTSQSIADIFALPQISTAAVTIE